MFNKENDERIMVPGAMPFKENGNADYDVIVVGGGISGFFASLTAARAGAKVLLIEGTSSIGGIVVEGPLEAFMTFHDEDGLIASGLTIEFIERLVREGGSVGYVPDTVGYCKSIVAYDSEIVRFLLFSMLRESRVHILLNSIVTGAKTDKGRIVDVQVVVKNGSTSFKAKAFVDATGDGDLAFHSGASVMMGRSADGKVQPMTLLFQIAGVNVEQLFEYVQENYGKFKFGQESIDKKEVTNLHLWGFGDILAQGFENGDLSLRRLEAMMIVSFRPGVVVVNHTRYTGNPLDNSDVTEAQYVTLKQAHEFMRYLKRTIPAFSHAYISHTGKIGIRESRRVVGKRVLSLDDILKPECFDDTVAKGAFPMDIHQPDGISMDSKKITKAYDIPAACLTSQDFDNLFMCGRCISATHEAMASTRITATSMATGQAAGVLAAMKALHDNPEFTAIKEKMKSLHVL